MSFCSKLLLDAALSRLLAQVAGAQVGKMMIIAYYSWSTTIIEVMYFFFITLAPEEERYEDEFCKDISSFLTFSKHKQNIHGILFAAQKRCSLVQAAC